MDIRILVQRMDLSILFFHFEKTYSPPKLQSLVLISFLVCSVIKLMLNHANTNHIYGLKDKINKYAAEKRIKPQVVCFSVFNTTMTSRRIYSTWTIPYNNRISSNSLFKKIVIKSVEAHESNNELNNEQLITLEKNKRYTLI